MFFDYVNENNLINNNNDDNKNKIKINAKLHNDN